MDQERRKVRNCQCIPSGFFYFGMHWCQRFCCFLQWQIHNNGVNAMIQGAVDALNASLR